MENEVEKFLGDLPTQEHKLDDLGVTEPKEQVEEEVRTPEEPYKNRHHRRLEEQLRNEQDSNIALNERIRVLSEIGRTSMEADIDPRLLRAFGTSEEGKEVSKIFSEILSEKTSQARDLAIAEMESKQREEVQEQRHYESVIDSELESIEETYNVDLTSDAPRARKTRREFLELVQELSPKDEDGTISDYADFEGAFKLYQRAQEKPEPSRAKDIADRSMTRNSGGSVLDQPTQRVTWGVARNAINKILGS